MGTEKNGTGGTDDYQIRAAEEAGWRAEYGPVGRELGGKLQLWKGATCLWRETPTLWIAAEWDVTPSGEAYRWQHHREYRSFEDAMEGENG